MGRRSYPQISDIKRFRLLFLSASLYGTFRSVIAMDGDRVETNVGQAREVEHIGKSEDAPRLPKKRFIGRRAAAGKAATRNNPSASIEDSGAIQGSRCDGPSRANCTHYITQSPNLVGQLELSTKSPPTS